MKGTTERLLRNAFFSYNSSMMRRERVSEKRLLRYGFTGIEMTVVAAIITIISGIILVRFSVFSGGAELQRASRELGLAYRKAQNMALSVRKGATAVAPSSYGVYINRTTTPITVIIFGDLSGNGRFDGAPTDVVVETLRFDRSITVTDLLCNATGVDNCTNTADASFLVPEARASIYGNAGSENLLQVVMGGIGATYTRTVVIRASGQIFLQ